MAQPTHYYRPRTLNEAVMLAAQPNTLAIAGGALMFGQQAIPYETFVDLQDVAELKAVEVTETGLRIGAACMLGSLLEHDTVPAALKNALTRSISPHVLNHTSVGEAFLRREDPALREWLAVLVAMGAAAETIIPERPVTLREWRTITTVDSRILGELIAALFLPMGPTTRVGLAQVSRTPADQAMLCAAVCVSFNGDGRVARATAALHYGEAREETEFGTIPPVQPQVLGTLIGWPLNAGTIHAIIEERTPHASQHHDAVSSHAYQAAVAAVCMGRALEQCVVPEDAS